MPSGYAVLPVFDVDSIVHSLELSLGLPPPMCLNPREAPSQGIMQCTYLNWFLPCDTQSKSRCCYFPAAAHRMQRFLAFKLGCHELPIVVGRQSGVPRGDRLCPHCNAAVLGDELHMIFECAFLQPLRSRFGRLFSADTRTMRAFFSQADFGGVLDFVLSCLTRLGV